LAQTSNVVSNSTSPIDAQIQALKSQLNALQSVADTYGTNVVSSNTNITTGPTPLFQDPNSITLNVAADSSADALSQCEVYQKQNPSENVSCVWQGTLIGNLPGNATATTAEYQSWVNNWQSNDLDDVTYANAWGNCQALIANNPGASVRCVWNNQTLYSQTGTSYPVTNTQTPIYNGATAEDVPPQGAVGEADCSAITGYAFDSNAPADSINILFYEDGPMSAGKLLTSTTADVFRSDINSEFNITGYHGFSIPTPDALRDGQTHTLYIYAENSDPAYNLTSEISGSPVSINCAAPAVTYPAYDYSQYGPLYTNYPYDSSTAWTNGYDYNDYYSQPWY